ncbi:hypothetical protein E2320_004324 [Naja naja]|nr:hypothetical protein E2320_004324 [Naja naja]
MSWNEEKLMHTFNGIRFTTRSSPELLNALVSFDAREDDILLVSYPKSGTHWLAEILTHIYASKVALTSPIEFGDLSKLDQLDRLSGKRIIPTHLDSNLLPPTFRVKHCKKSKGYRCIHVPLLSRQSKSSHLVCGSWFDHVLSWEKHLHEKNILFLFYEDMKKDLPKVMKELSAFLGLNPTESQIYEICKKSSFNEMKTNTEKENSDENHTVCVLTSNPKLIFRKGTVGDWKNHFTPKQNRLFEETFKKKMTFSEVAKHLVYEC